MSELVDESLDLSTAEADDDGDRIVDEEDTAGFEEEKDELQL